MTVVRRRRREMALYYKKDILSKRVWRNPVPSEKLDSTLAIWGPSAMRFMQWLCEVGVEEYEFVAKEVCWKLAKESNQMYVNATTGGAKNKLDATIKFILNEIKSALWSSSMSNTKDIIDVINCLVTYMASRIWKNTTLISCKRFIKYFPLLIFHDFLPHACWPMVFIKRIEKCKDKLVSTCSLFSLERDVNWSLVRDPVSPTKLVYSNSIRIDRASVSDMWLHFQNNITGMHMNQLYIRDCYKNICNAIKTSCRVVGSPGSGKRAFMYYLLWRLVHEGKRVVFVWSFVHEYYNATESASRYTKLSDFSDQDFWTPDLWCLVIVNDKTQWIVDPLLAASVASTIVFVDVSATALLPTFCLPSWTNEELRSVVPCFKNYRDWQMDLVDFLKRNPKFNSESFPLENVAIV